MRSAFVAVVLMCLPALAWAQAGSLAGTVRDSSGGVLPGVTVGATSPGLIEKVRSTVTDENGRYQMAAPGLTGIYTDANTARRIVSSYQRAWTDRDGDRIVVCDLMVPALAPTTNSFPNNGECGAMAGFSTTNTARRFGRSPEELDEANRAIGLRTTQCGRTDSTRIPQAAIDYCNAYFAAGGESLLEGWASAVTSGSSALASSARSCRGFRRRSPTTAARRAI